MRQSIAVDAGGSARNAGTWERGLAPVMLVVAVFAAAMPAFTAVAAPPSSSTSSGWGTAQLIEASSAPIGYEGVQLAVAPSGTAIAVWIQDDNSGRPSVWANRFVPGTGWGTAALIGNSSSYWDDYFGPQGIYGPQVAMDADENAFVVWYDYWGNIWASRFVPDDGWEAETMINYGSDIGYVANSYDPQVAVQAGGNAFVVWIGSDADYTYSCYDAYYYYQWYDSCYVVWANRYVAGQGWQGAERVESQSGAHAWSADVAVDANGNAQVVWTQYTDETWDYSKVFANRYASGTGWGTETAISGLGLYDARPEVAMDGNGTAIAVWSQLDSTSCWSLWANRDPAGTGWGTAEAIESLPYSSLGVQISMDSNGSAVVVWEQEDSIRANRYVPGSGWQGQTRLDGSTRIDRLPPGHGDYSVATSPSVAVDAAGNAVAVWVKRPDSGSVYSVWASRFTNGSGWGNAALVESNDTGSAFAPDVGVDASGNAVAAWSQTNGTLTSAWANQFTPPTDSGGGGKGGGGKKG